MCEGLSQFLGGGVQVGSRSQLAQIGVETPLPEKRKSLQKNISDSGFIDAFHLLRKEGIQAGAHFLVGFSDDSIDTVKNCIAMARRLNAVYCSINIFQNRFGAESLPRQPKLKEMIMSLDAKINMGKYNLDKYLKFMFSS